MRVDLNDLTNIVHAGPVFVSGDTGPVGTAVTTAQVAFVPTNAALVIQSFKKAIVPLGIKMKVTTEGAASTSAHALFCIDAGARYSSGGAQLICGRGLLNDAAFAGRTQHIANGGFGSAASWTPSLDFSIAAGLATFSHV